MFSPEKKKYNVGENIEINFPSSAGGHALVTLENGSEVIATLWAPTTDKITKLSIPATKEMAPNVYVNIMLLQPHNSESNDLPLRTYGIAPVEVVDPERC